MVKNNEGVRVERGVIFRSRKCNRDRRVLEGEILLVVPGGVSGFELMNVMPQRKRKKSVTNIPFRSTTLFGL